jgi:hypothetical protein
MPTPWYTELTLGQSWSSLWSGYILCGNCRGIRRVPGSCPACDDPPYRGEPTKYRLPDGREVEIAATFMGAEGRIEDYLYLEMLQREWERPAPEFERFKSYPMDKRPSARAALVLLFWGYFETRIERLLEGAMQDLSEPVRDDVLGRYASIGVRLHRLYKLLFGQTYFDDLRESGFQAVSTLLADLHQRRNAFTHGNPHSIDDATVNGLVDALKTEHEAWIAVFNKRATRARLDPST